MIVKRMTYFQLGAVATTLTECDEVQINKLKDSISVVMLRGKDNEIVIDQTFTEKTRLFIMEKGKTVDRIDFKC